MSSTKSVLLIAGLCLASFAAGRITITCKNKKKKKYVKQAVDVKKIKQMTREEFVDIYRSIAVELIDEMKTNYEMPSDAVSKISTMLDYTLVGGKLNRGLTVVHTACILNPSLINDAVELRRVSALGWVIEWMQASFLVADDMMDSSITRRGKPCWYRNEEIGLSAINDSFILLTQIAVVLNRFFGGMDCFNQLNDLIVETTYQTELGQHLDLTTQPIVGPVDLNKFTIERHYSIVKYKTSFYSFYAPVALGLIYSGVTDPQILSKTRDICVKMGVYFQIQDDYLDCYADPEVLGKVGTDIQDNKCSWLIVQALKIASDEDKKVLKENYGIDNEKNINIVKKVYKKLNLTKLYEEYEANVVNELRADIASITTIPNEVFTTLLNKIYKRNK